MSLERIAFYLEEKVLEGYGKLIIDLNLAKLPHLRYNCDSLTPE